MSDGNVCFIMSRVGDTVYLDTERGFVYKKGEIPYVVNILAHQNEKFVVTSDIFYQRLDDCLNNVMCFSVLLSDTLYKVKKGGGVSSNYSIEKV